MRGQLRTFDAKDYDAWDAVRDPDGLGPLIFEDLFVKDWPPDTGEQYPFITMIADCNGIDLSSEMLYMRFEWNVLSMYTMQWMARELVTMGENYALSVEFLEHLGFDVVD